MSRSRKHTPIGGNAVAYSEKKEKRLANRRLRRIHREIIAGLDDPEDEPLLPSLKEVSQPWSWSKDGKSYYGDSPRFDPAWMRK